MEVTNGVWKEAPLCARELIFPYAQGFANMPSVVQKHAVAALLTKTRLQSLTKTRLQSHQKAVFSATCGVEPISTTLGLPGTTASPDGHRQWEVRHYPPCSEVEFRRQHSGLQEERQMSLFSGSKDCASASSHCSRICLATAYNVQGH